ncbi:MAG TPA: signal peptidase II [Chryseolinea sp.]|nr:signal peptidase II [Chryseolinea sp.]
MKTNFILRTLIILVILIINVSCDQISKSIVRQTIQYNERIGLVNDHVTLTKVENIGAFLSLGNSLPNILRIILLIVLPGLAMAYGLYFLLTKTTMPKATLIGLSFVLGGGIGNMYDRITYGSVTDFVHIDFIIFQTGVFNMADVSIMMGMFLILIQASTKELTGKLRA